MELRYRSASPSPLGLAPMTPVVPATIVPITPVIVPIVITRSVVIGISVVIARIITRVVIGRWTYEDPKVDTGLRRLRSESH